MRRAAGLILADLGDFDSGASALALPITRAAGLLQVRPDRVLATGSP